MEKAGGAGFRTPVARVVAIGGAGSNILDRSALDGIDKDFLCSVNTDVQSLSASVAGNKVQIGRTVTRGLGTGGDPELGIAAAEESIGELRELFVGTNLVFLCTGLGGGTGSGAAPFCARLAREAGAVVLAFVTMPFEFEGRRRNEQAAEALAAIEEEADAVVCFENDRMGQLAGGRGGIQDAFLRADQTVSQAIRAVLDFTSLPSLMRVGVDDLVTVLRAREAQCLFGFGEGEGGSAVHDALAAALKCPLMDRSRMAAEAGAVLAQVTGGPGMTYVEVQSLMGELGKHINPRAQVFLGIAIDHACASRIRLTLFSAFGARQSTSPSRKATSSRQEALDASYGKGMPTAASPPDEPASAPEPTAIVETSLPGISIPELSQQVAATPETAASLEIPAACTTAGSASSVSPPERSKSTKPGQAAAKSKGPRGPRQEAFQFETVSRGRFDNSEPNIVDGEDLDVPAFMRKGVRIR